MDISKVGLGGIMLSVKSSIRIDILIPEDVDLMAICAKVAEYKV
jgi:hypothetical protein